MNNFDDLQNAWTDQYKSAATPALDLSAIEKLSKKRADDYFKKAVSYFWSSLVYQIILYAFLSNVFFRHFSEIGVRYLSVTGVVILLPFTCFFMYSFQSFAKVNYNPENKEVVPSKEYISEKIKYLENFYRFKKWYESILIPMSLAIAFLLIFKMYAASFIDEHLILISALYVIGVSAYLVFLRRENNKIFDGPLTRLRSILKEFDSLAHL